MIRKILFECTNWLPLRQPKLVKATQDYTITWSNGEQSFLRKDHEYNCVGVDLEKGYELTLNTGYGAHDGVPFWVPFNIATPVENGGVNSLLSHIMQGLRSLRKEVVA